MTVGLAAAVALAEKSESLQELRAARTREHAECKQRDRRHSPEGNRRERRAAQAIYRRATKHDR